MSATKVCTRTSFTLPSKLWLHYQHQAAPVPKSIGSQPVYLHLARKLWTNSVVHRYLSRWNMSPSTTASTNHFDAPLTNQCSVQSIHIDQTICFTKYTDALRKERTTLPSHMISDASTLSPGEYEEIVEDTLHSLNDYFDEILEKSSLTDFDVFYSDGVLTVKIGPRCTYVINKQTPNKQIWLSSPFSGPKRYDFENQTWIYKHDNLGTSLHSLLNDEIPKLIPGVSIDFVTNCSYGKVISDQAK